LFILTAVVAVGCAAPRAGAFIGLAPSESVAIGVLGAMLFAGSDWKNFRIRHASAAVAKFPMAVCVLAFSLLVLGIISILVMP
jgi:hypothetical protein